MSTADLVEEKNVEDPRSTLARWANGKDEWVRFLVKSVLASGHAVDRSDVEYAYDLFRQAKGLEERTLPVEPDLAVETVVEEKVSPLVIRKLDKVSGVNALVSTSVIEPHDGLTILYGENGTGKTGYSRVFKALAGSRTADPILGDVAAVSQLPVSASISYLLGTELHELDWRGDFGRSPFTRMSIFDSPAVTFHVDDELEYVYVPAVLALFNHVSSGIKEVKQLIDADLLSLTKASPSLLHRFPRDSVIYPQIETLGATSDLVSLKALADTRTEADADIEQLQTVVAALQTDSASNTLALTRRQARVLDQALTASEQLGELDLVAHNEMHTSLKRLESDRDLFRTTFFETADLPVEPEERWERFVQAGAEYQEHLDSSGSHDDSRCLYCRQQLTPAGHALLARYSEYLLDKIGKDIASAKASITSVKSAIERVDVGEVRAFVDEFAELDVKPSFLESLKPIVAAFDHARTRTRAGEVIDVDLVSVAGRVSGQLSENKATVDATILELQKQVSDRDELLKQKRADLQKLQVAVELGRCWAELEAVVVNAKEADKLRLLAKPFSGFLRTLTDLSKAASDHLVNESFDSLFLEECEALRAPSLKVEFIGRQGRAHRKKVLSGKHRPSKILSEGEQKVLAMADFLAEARLSGISAPVIFDDPVSSLDHRRINEVADRIARLADTIQVIVFTHDVLFAAALISRFEKSKRCRFYQITDDGGKGKVTAASGPRWDSISELTKKVNLTIEAAKKESGDTREALIRTGYGWLRSWCEVFTEMDLLQGVSQRYRPNIQMTVLSKINGDALGIASEAVFRVFEDACRYIDSHSQPLAALNVVPALSDLEADWQEMKDVRSTYLKSLSA
ncbi:AAA family ATPase [Rathayibacter iranicus]|uniref:Protein CR006 P-loop domain-containing protein n=2 Tax=Rathayibacter iranicus TaxID=59737 RepID=A0AAD1ACK4_9MICO|nr:AAA family ATPase [Rathayibacter iranicus]AZZ55896.1 hypothetical protein C7V51_08430 [Rathayibacter iranicus]MWV30660.1 AAA family ATPase [Rathayibacter iranicus NCPPB 2253 = VKM Ac-1602]PPI47220.1 hypothetical protein C5E09_07465 [Rathayibacter iranicus]PPI60263.1 hypothetical protein C5E08_08395 [Rathayibacter iranicus]PPI71727.1 hypothetical protein C5E01_07430 [Rathayibacter iranicus]